MSVSEYLNKFNHLARYSLYDVATEERKVDKFLGGLNQHLRCTLSMFDFPDFQTLVNKALIVGVKTGGSRVGGPNLCVLG